MGGDILAQLGLAAGVAAASGMRLYATVAALGLLHRFGVLQLPSGLDALAEPWVIGLASALYVVEFIADKVPAVDTVWDAIHTFIRIPHRIDRRNLVGDEFDDVERAGEADHPRFRQRIEP